MPNGLNALGPEGNTLPTAIATQPAAQPAPPAPSPATPTATPTQATQPTTAPAPAVAPPVSPQQRAAAIQNAHHSMLGRAASFLLGREYDYKVNPQSGQVEQVPVQQKPGDLFRSILAGALLGSAAGSQARDFAGGAGMGGTAVIQNQRAMDQQRYARAQQAAQTQREEQRFQQTFAEEKRMHDAQIAQMNANALRADWQMGFQTEKGIQEHNDSERAFQLQLDQMGATPMQVMSGGTDINGKTGNGKELQRIAGQDLNAVKAPPGFHTLATSTVDTTGLTMKGGQWVDSTGNPVNIEDRTKWTVYQMPDNLWNEPAKGIKTGKDANDLAGYKLFDPDAKINMTVGQAAQLKGKGDEFKLEAQKLRTDAVQARLAAANERRQIELAKLQAGTEQYKAFQTAYETTKQQVAALQDQIKARADMGQDTSDLQQQLNEATGDLEAIRVKLFPSTAAPAKPAKAAAKPAAAQPTDETATATTLLSSLSYGDAVQRVQDQMANGTITKERGQRVLDALKNQASQQAQSRQQAIGQVAGGLARGVVGAPGGIPLIP